MATLAPDHVGAGRRTVEADDMREQAARRSRFFGLVYLTLAAVLLASTTVLLVTGFFWSAVAGLGFAIWAGSAAVFLFHDARGWEQ